ncbi:MAG: glycosyl hydrolase family 98, partial [Candidatus Symbiothrix sp.]|nr:glycosyl hydrolase family 98 [Candidatus Symbiothrix sp.]
MKRLFISIFIGASVLFNLNAQTATPLRRPISNVSPTWLIHIDVWAKADPMKVIDLIPEDVLPYVIFNLSLSVSDPGTGPYGINVNTVSIVESWMRACAERGVWAAIQPASGYECNLPYTHTANDIYEKFYQDYPNFLGYNFAEQCWGFVNSANEEERIALFSGLIQLAAQYGGYLFVSHTQTINSPQTNALAFLKRSSDFRYWAKRYKDNYVTIEKYTTSRGFYDIESTSLGAYLSGYCGNYGMRFDNCGWTYVENRKDIPFPESLGGMLIAEHFLLTGTTVQDGPEL